MAYNPNEFLRLKHLNEFARQFNIKLDGGTDPKPARPITSMKYTLVVSGSGTSTNIPNDGIINMTTAEVRSKGIQIVIKTPCDVMPRLLDFSSSSNAQFASAEYHFIGYSLDDDAWNLILATGQSYDMRQNVSAGVISFTLHFDETDEFAAFDQPITINITEG